MTDMIIFDLSCINNHVFEAWFQSQATYAAQLTTRLITCPHCGSSEIRRIPSAVHLAKPTPVTDNASSPTQIDPVYGVSDAYQHLLKLITSTSDDVGNDFAAEARKIHYCETPARSIRGEATPAEYKSLREEGIEVLRLPKIKSKDFH